MNVAALEEAWGEWKADNIHLNSDEFDAAMSFRTHLVKSDALSVILSPDEMEAMGHVLAAMSIIKGWGLLHNETELAIAVHGLQTFIVQHMLQRLEPEHWGKWFGEIRYEGTPG